MRGGWGRGEEEVGEREGVMLRKNAQKTDTDIWNNTVTAHPVCNAEYHNT